MKKIKAYMLLATCLIPSTSIWAQEDKTEVKEETTDEQIDSSIAGFFDSDEVNFTTLKLPSLDILFSNAKSNPSVELLAKEERIAKELLKKEKTDFLSHITGHGSYSYGIMDNYGSNSSVTSPIYYQYMGSKQHYWNIGANISFSAEDIIDAKRKVKRQQLEVEKVGIEKDIAYEDLKKEIVRLYVEISTGMTSLKSSAKNAVSAQGYSDLVEQEFSRGDVDAHDVLDMRRWENEATNDYHRAQRDLITNILTLEIMTHTPIITNITTDMTIDNIEK